MTLLQDLSAIVGAAFAREDIDAGLGEVRVSDRPDLAQFQCNGALGAAKALKTNPRALAEKIAVHLRAEPVIAEVTIAGPGFLNLTLTDDYLVERLGRAVDSTGWQSETSETIVLDYGGPNVAKPLHVGHLRAAIIGESLKRILRLTGAKVIGDVHLGDWGLQMGQLISELALRAPELIYFDPDAAGPFPEDPPVSLKDLEDMYPVASAACKADPERRELARKATFDLQEGRAGYRALWHHFVTLSKAAIKDDYDALGVSFDLWKGEADADPFIAPMVEALEQKGLVEESDGARIIRVERDDDRKTVPPIMLITSEGSVGYHTTDLATIVDRMESQNPDRILYVVDQRQALHFEQVFRASAMAGYLGEDRLEHLGFGTMNGKDGKPFKTREGGVLKLQDMVAMVETRAHERLVESGMTKGLDASEIAKVARQVGVAALKFADLSNPRTSDYIFDLDRFTSFEGKTGPYLQYACVRIQSILNRLQEGGKDTDLGQGAALVITKDEERDLILCLMSFSEVIKNAYEKRMPHLLAEHAFTLAQTFSRFYAACRVTDEGDDKVRASRTRLLTIVREQLGLVLDLLGIEIPDRM